MSVAQKRLVGALIEAQTNQGDYLPLHHWAPYNSETPWSWPKILTTTVPKEWQKHEYVQLHLRGTGLNNHHASFFKIDDNVILDHAYYIGLYLAVVDRRDLTLVESAFYDTSALPYTWVVDENRRQARDFDLDHDGFAT